MQNIYYLVSSQTWVWILYLSFISSVTLSYVTWLNLFPHLKIKDGNAYFSELLCGLNETTLI